MLRRTALATLAAVLLAAAAACSGGDDEVLPADVLQRLATEVIIPSYEALVANLDALDASLAPLCATPSIDGLGAVRASWRDAELAWQSTRAGGVGPAVERRLMADVGFRADAADVEALVPGDAPLDPDALDDLGAGVRGLGAIEVALFAPGSTTLTTAYGARRCTYARAAARLSRDATAAVLATWTDGPEPYLSTFVVGMDGDPQSSLEALVSEMTFRLQQIDDQGLRTLVEARGPDEVPAGHREGPAAFGLGSLRGVLGGVAAIVHGPDDDGLAALVRSRSDTLADRLEDRTDLLVRALAELPDSSAAALADRTALAAAAEAAAALKVLVGTEVASRLGVTIGFSDADGDS